MRDVNHTRTSPAGHGGRAAFKAGILSALEAEHLFFEIHKKIIEKIKKMQFSKFSIFFEKLKIFEKRDFS